MARMLGKTKLPQLCPYGCCTSWWHYSKQANKAKRAVEKRTWRKEVGL